MKPVVFWFSSDSDEAILRFILDDTYVSIFSDGFTLVRLIVDRQRMIDRLRASERWTEVKL